jgi:hypothetical protein
MDNQKVVPSKAPPVSNLGMDGLRTSRRESVASKMTATGLLLCTGITVGLTVFFRLPAGFKSITSGFPLVDAAARITPLVFLCAAFLIFSMPRLGYGLGSLTGLLAVPWLIWTELLFYDGSWAVLNYVGATPGDRALTVFVMLRLLSVALIVITTTCCSLRMLPSRWHLMGSPLCQRTWPAFALGFLVVGLWFFHSARPYRVPLIVDGGQAVFRALHIQKRGLQFNEIGVSTTRDGGFTAWGDDRHLFQYRFEGHVAGGILTRSVYDRVDSLVGSPALWSWHTPPARVLRSWNAEGWYVVLRDQRLLAFTTENGIAPPRDVIDLLHEIDSLPRLRSEHGPVQDVCLGFCYGPVAALGFWYSNQPCFKLTNGTTDCR